LVMPLSKKNIDNGQITTSNSLPVHCHYDTGSSLVYYRFCFTAVITRLTPFHRPRPNASSIHRHLLFKLEQI
jgi:hypothetical protein